MAEKQPNNLRWIWHTTKTYHGRAALLCVLSVFHTLITLWVAVNLKDLINAAVARDRHQLTAAAVLMIVLVLLEFGLKVLLRYLRDTTSFRIVQSLQQSQFSFLLNKDYTFVSEKHSVEWMNRIMLDIDGIASLLTKILPDVIGIMISLIGTGYLIFQITPYFLILVVLGGAALVLLNFFLKEGLKQRQRELREAIGVKNIYLTEHLSKLLVVKSFNRESVIEEESKDKFDAMTRKKTEKLRLQLFKDGAQSFSISAAYLLVLLYCAVQILQGQISYGTSVMFMRLVSQLSTPMKDMGTYISQFFDISVSAERLREVEAYPDDPSLPVKDDQEIHRFYERDFKDITFQDATFSYHTQDEDYAASVPRIFSHVNICIPKHSCVAFTGITGSGKSTFFKLLMSFYSLQQGTKTLHTNSGETLPLDASFRRLFAYVPQGNQLMVGTIREMVTFGIKTSPETDAEIWQVLDEACAKDFVEKLPKGLDTVIREKGAGLSEGQLQRIAIARALFTKRPILLLDEATSALDEGTEQEILLHLKKMTDRTILFVTHRPNALSICDREVHINGTKVTVRELPCGQ